MRFLRLLPLMAVFVAAACDEPGKVTHTQTPPLAYIRYVNAVPNSPAIASSFGGYDFRFVDGTVDYSPQYPASAYRSVGTYKGARAGQRRIMVNVNSSNIITTQTVLVDTTLNLTAGNYYTILHVGTQGATDPGTKRAPGTSFIVLQETMPTPGAGIQVSALNMAPAAGGIDIFSTDTLIRDSSTVRIPSLTGKTPIITNAVFAARTPYVSVATTPAPYTAANATTAIPRRTFQTATTGSTTRLAAFEAPPGLPGDLTTDPITGTGQAGTAYTLFYFPSGTGAAAASVVLTVDLHPARTRPEI